MQDNMINRPVVVATVVGALFWIALLAVFAHHATYLEFVRARPLRLEDMDLLPNLAVLYYKFHHYDWIAFAMLAVWGAWLSSSARRTPLAITIYLSVVINIGTFWGLLTLLVLYMVNQTFVAGR